MRAAIVVACLAVPALAAADPAPTSASARDPRALVSDDCARARRLGAPCVLSLPAEPIIGERAAGDGSVLQVLQLTSTASLIRIRRDFVSEIVHAAEDL